MLLAKRNEMRQWFGKGEGEYYEVIITDKIGTCLKCGAGGTEIKE
jgi:hypothetical protein